MIRRFVLGLVALFLFSSPVLAATTPTLPSTSYDVGVCDPRFPQRCIAPDANGVIPTKAAPPAAGVAAGTTAPATITNTSTQVVAAGQHVLLAIDNESASASIACRFGGTAALNTAGSFTFPPGTTRVWNSYPVPVEALNCISSASTSPATVEVF